MARFFKHSAAWVSLDRSDNHAASFSSYLIEALQKVEPGFNPGANAISLLQSPQPPPIEAVLTLLLNELSAMSMDLVLVLDDYHVIDARDIHDGMVFLLDHLPPRLHLVSLAAPIRRCRWLACGHGASSSRSAPKICGLRRTRSPAISMSRWVSI